MAVAIAVGRNGVDTLLVASQVALSIVLPFIVFPLLYLTCSKSIMSVKKPISPPPPPVSSTKSQEEALPATDDAAVEDIEASIELVNYSNGRVVTVLGWILWLVIVAANVYAIVTLALGEST